MERAPTLGRPSGSVRWDPGDWFANDTIRDVAPMSDRYPRRIDGVDYLFYIADNLGTLALHDTTGTLHGESRRWLISR